jgi:hypothetical protein
VLSSLIFYALKRASPLRLIFKSRSASEYEREWHGKEWIAALSLIQRAEIFAQFMLRTKAFGSLQVVMHHASFCCRRNAERRRQLRLASLDITNTLINSHRIQESLVL